jgi:hypothetical protein
MIDECLREADVVEEIETGRWPGARSAELLSHVASCAICGDVVTVAGAIRGECESARAAIRVPSAGLVWWRAQLRARQQVAEAAGRPITYAQAAAAAFAAVLLFMLGGLLWPSLRASITWIDQVSQAVDIGRFWLPATLAVGASLVLAPVLLLFVLLDD